uniref:ADH_zinc_N domain-containing protein n=1 Tax=Globodera pallida TaxID=36090 RepID=A0A183BIS8_GLOPA
MKKMCKIDPKMPLDMACLLACGVPTGYGAPLNGCAVNVGDVVGVWGLGTIGLAAVMGAAEAGASRLVAVDPNEKRFKMAKELGATECVKPEEGLQKYFFQKFNGGLDIAFEATGNIKAMRQAFECTKRGSGRTCIMGIHLRGLEMP